MIMASRKTVNVAKPRNTRELKANPNLKIKKDDLDRLLKIMFNAKEKVNKIGE